MSKRVFGAGLTFTLLLAFSGATAKAGTISVGAYTPSTTSFFTVPILITGAEGLTTWQFSLQFNPSDLQVYDDFILDPAPVREGPFTSSGGAFLSLFVPGFIFNSIGLLDTVAGAYVDLPPGPSGDGVLAYVDFIGLGTGGLSPITLQDASVTTATPEPSTIVLLSIVSAWVGTRRLTRRLPSMVPVQRWGKS